MKYRLPFISKTTRIIIVILLTYFFPCLHQAKAIPNKGSDEKYQVHQLGEIIVTGVKDEKNSPTTIVEVSGTEIEQYHATNLGEALTLLPGIYFRQGRVKQESYVSLRGFEQDKVLILLDGIPIYQPYEGLVNLADIPTQNIAKIKIIKGLASSLYGPNTMGGVINVITKKGGINPEASITYQVSDYNTHHIEGTYGQRVGDISYYFGISHKESDGFPLADDFTLPDEILSAMATAPSPIPHTPVKPDSGLRDNTDYQRTAVTFTGNWDMSKHNTLGLSVEYYNNEYGIPPAAIYRETRKAGGTAHWYPRYWRFDDWERYMLNVTEEFRIFKALTIKARFFYDDYQSKLNAYDNNNYNTQLRTAGAPSFDSEYDDYNTGLNLYCFWDGIEKHHIRMGYSFKRDVHESQFKFNLSPPEGEKFVTHTYSAALEDHIYIGDRIILTIGASYDTFEQVKRRQSSGSNKGGDIYSFNPQTGLRYELSENAELYTSVGKKIRFPTMRNLYANGVIGPQGNPNLKEEKTINYELGGHWRFNNRIMFESALFYSDIDNLILFDNQIGRFEQWDSAAIHGAEISILANITASLTGRLSYTYLVADNDDSIVTIELEHLENDLIYRPDEIPYRPKHKIDLDITQSFGPDLEIHVNGSFVSDQKFYYHADPTDNRQLIAEKRSLDDFLLLNAKVTYDFNKHYQIFGAVENLLNEDYQELYLSPAPGIRGWIGLKISM